VERIIGHLKGASSGATLLICSALHGNEKATVLAAQRVIAKLTKGNIAFSGEVVALLGNPTAFLNDVRYIDIDLNRVWSADRCDLLAKGESLGTNFSEDVDQRELFTYIEEVFFSVPGRDNYLLDLHTTSSEGAPFMIAIDKAGSIELGSKLPITSIHGVEGEIEDVMIEYYANRGVPSLVVEGGWHYSPFAIDCLEAAIWILMEQVGIVTADSFEDSDSTLEESHAVLAKAKNGLPTALEITYNHMITPEDEFLMRPGFLNFQSVGRGELLGKDKNGPVFSPDDGRVFMPLYQGQGNQGFLLTKPLRS
jgi:succinylglutamate desuccinylase